MDKILISISFLIDQYIQILRFFYVNMDVNIVYVSDNILQGTKICM